MGRVKWGGDFMPFVMLFLRLLFSFYLSNYLTFLLYKINKLNFMTLYLE